MWFVVAKRRLWKRNQREDLSGERDAPALSCGNTIETV
jgi:hypothetical protein